MNTGLSGMNSSLLLLRTVLRYLVLPYLHTSALLQSVVTRARALKARKQRFPTTVHRRERLAQAVMYTADWTVETAISQLRQENIFLQPTFQRRDAWRISRKSRLVESILLGLPIPQIVLAERQDERGKFIVLDGKQRLLTLLQFVGGANGSVNNNFALRDMEVLEELNGLRFEALSVDAKRQFMNYAIRSSIIRNWPDSAFLEIVFVRLNEGSVKLSPQELRQGISPGPFTSYLEEASAESPGLKALLGLDEPDFRMRDAELLLRLVAFSMFPNQYRANMKVFLDNTTDKLNTDWTKEMDSVVNVKTEIEAAIAKIREGGFIDASPPCNRFSPSQSRVIFSNKAGPCVNLQSLWQCSLLRSTHRQTPARRSAKEKWLRS